MTKEALKLALEALDHLITEFRIHDLPYGSKAYTKGTNAIREIQAVLAQPEQEQLMSDQINYGMSVTQGGKRIDPMSIYKEPEQEPVAEVDDWRDSIFTRYVEYLPSGTRLYTTPPQRKPLTDEEIDALWLQHDFIRAPDRKRQAFARAIEAAHGIKGEA